MSVSLNSVTDRMRFRFWRFRDSMRDRLQGRRHRQGVFERIYRENLWGDPESASGTGSGTEATALVRHQLPELFRELNVRAVLDAPCGDFAWARDVAGGLERYVGFDIVPDLIVRNRERYASETVSFVCGDLAADPLPAADLILCRDCFIHLPTRMIRAALRNFRDSGARFLLLSNSPNAAEYRDIPIGSFRPIDVRRPPFSFPPPLRILDESRSGDRQLCLWELASLPIGDRDE